MGDRMRLENAGHIRHRTIFRQVRAGGMHMCILEWHKQMKG